MKTRCLLLCLCAFATAICAEPTDPCAGLAGSDLTQCRSNQQTLVLQQRLEQQLQQQQERQNQLDQQQREVRQQLDAMRLENESLRKQLEQNAAEQRAAPGSPPAPASSASRNADLIAWKAANPWYGSDYPRTQFATRYLKQLQKERPDLAGRALLDAVSTKVDETFGPKP